MGGELIRRKTKCFRSASLDIFDEACPQQVGDRIERQRVRMVPFVQDGRRRAVLMRWPSERQRRLRIRQNLVGKRLSSKWRYSCTEVKLDWNVGQLINNEGRKDPVTTTENQTESRHEAITKFREEEEEPQDNQICGFYWTTLCVCFLIWAVALIVIGIVDPSL